MLQPLALIASSEGSSWHYAAWVAIDLRLFIFILLIAILTGAGVTALVVKRRRWVDIAAMFIVSFIVTFALFLLIFNEIAQYPVFVVESFFQFP